MSKRIMPERLEELRRRFDLNTPPRKATPDQWKEAVAGNETQWSRFCCRRSATKRIERSGSAMQADVIRLDERRRRKPRRPDPTPPAGAMALAVPEVEAA